MTKQVRFLDVENNAEHGGIQLDNGDIICGCCGKLIPADEQDAEHGFELLEVYDVWVDLDWEIMGIG